LHIFPAPCTQRVNCAILNIINFTTCGGFYLGLLPDTHPVTLSLPVLNRAGGENEMKKLVGPDKDREIIYQLPS